MKRVDGNKGHFIWAENDGFYYDKDEALSSLEPLYPTNSRMMLVFSVKDFDVNLKPEGRNGVSLT